MWYPNYFQVAENFDLENNRTKLLIKIKTGGTQKFSNWMLIILMFHKV
jgi:hypothetical protein